MNIKINIKVVLLLCTLLTFSGCEDFLDLKPTDALVADLALENINDFQNALLGAYAGLRSGNYYGQNYVLTPGILADNLKITSQTQGRLVQEHRWTFTSGSGLASGVWLSGYDVIYRANDVLSKVDALDAPQQDKDRIKGQAYALRGMAHFDLLRWFGESYDRNHSAPQSGIPIKLDQELSFPARSTVQEVYDQVYADLEQARTLLADKTNFNIAEPHYINETVVAAILARVSLYAEQYQAAAGYATEVIEENDLAEGSEFISMWTPDENIGEVLFSVPYNTGNWASIVWNPNFDTYEFAPSQDLIDTYDQAQDIRWDSYFEVYPDRTPVEVVVGKYQGTEGDPGRADVKVFRVAEMYLIRAEARALGNIDGGISGANNDLNYLREHRIAGYSPQSYSSGQIIEEIDLERRRELAFEGHRWFDIKRRGDAVFRGDDYITASENFELAAGNFRFVLPIPAGEILANPNIEQNTGY